MTDRRNPRDVRVLVACEESQTVCCAFRKSGEIAWVKEAK